MRFDWVFISVSAISAILSFVLMPLLFYGRINALTEYEILASAIIFFAGVTLAALAIVSYALKKRTVEERVYLVVFIGTFNYLLALGYSHQFGNPILELSSSASGIPVVSFQIKGEPFPEMLYYLWFSLLAFGALTLIAKNWIEKETETN